MVSMAPRMAAAAERCFSISDWRREARVELPGNAVGNVVQGEDIAVP